MSELKPYFRGVLIMNNEKDFKDLPEGWKFSKVKDLFIDGRGRIISEEEIKSKEGIYPVYSSQTHNNGELGKINTYDFEGEFITWTTDGANAGTVFYRSGKFNCTNVCGILKPRNKNINVKFFSCLLSTIAKKYVSYIGNPKLMNSTFRDIKIIHPDSYYEQRKIAEILETIDNAIEKTDKIIEKYKRIKQGLMQDLLTKGIDENGIIRDEKTHKFKDSPLGRIPEEWEVVRLGEVGEIIYGERLNDYEYVEDGSSIVYGTTGIIARTEKYIDVGETIILPRKGSINNKFYVEKDQKFFVIDTAFYVKFTKMEVNVKYIYYFLHQVNLELLNEATGVPSLNRENLKNLLLPLPPLPEQQRIAEILSQTDQTIEKEQQYKEKLQRIKQGLMQDLLTGKVRVNHLVEEKENEQRYTNDFTRT
jgi:type I restriction enzyme S subunit